MQLFFRNLFAKLFTTLSVENAIQSPIMLNNTQTYSDMWQNCLDRIKAQTSAEEFEKWFQPIVPLEFDGTTLLSLIHI